MIFFFLFRRELDVVQVNLGRAEADMPFLILLTPALITSSFVLTHLLTRIS